MKKKLLVPLFLAGMAFPLAAKGGEINVANALFIGEYGNRTEYIAHGTKLNGQMADEGFVLLKNRDNFFPLKTSAEAKKKVTIVGKSSINISRGGAGSGSGSVSDGVTSIDLQKSFQDANYEVNSTATSFYKSASGGRTNGNDGWKGNSEVTIGETPISSVTGNTNLINSFATYNDLAVQVITREGSEGCDVLTIDATDSTKYGSSDRHALQLSENEEALFNLLKEKFDNILILINSSNIFECDRFEKEEKVAGVLWIGNPGDVGPGAVGRIISGEVNPSGRTVDTWARDFTKDPTFQNFSDNRQTQEAIPDTSNRLKHASADTMFAADGSPMMSFGTEKSYTDHSSPNWLEEDYKVVKGGINGVKPAAYVSYEEGIYVDYRYYETRYADMAEVNKTTADTWYAGEQGVVYPFGYGLSYTTFDQKIIRMNPGAGAELNPANDLIEVSVEVENKGTVAGKDVVQLYWKAPYIKNGIEKADHVLCAFDKTKVLAPGEKQVLNLTFHLQDVANYDYGDFNENGHVGYELDAGDYSVMLMKNAHEAYESKNFVIKRTFSYFKDRFTGYEVTNRFTDNGFYSSMPGEDDIPFEQMSRADFEGTFPHCPDDESRTVGPNSRYEEFLTHEYSLREFEEGNYEYTPEAAKRTEEDAEGWEQQETALDKAERIQLIDMKDYDLDDPKWEEFMNEFTWDEMMVYVENNKMSSPSMSSIGKSGSSEGDGPQKFNIIWWVSSPIVAATFNQRLAHEQGEAIGMESQISGKAGWWGSAVNTHRSPFGGRNFEYYSADPFLMGRMAAQVVGAATDRGVYAYFKHFAVNDQEKNRESGISFVNEQALREIYLRSFQMVFEEGKSMGVMGSYNRLGLMETAANYMLMTEVLRNEWGFKGSVLSDMTHSGNGSVNFHCYECVTPRLLAGCNCQLDSGGFSKQTQDQAKWDAEMGGPVYTTSSGDKEISYSWWGAVRQAVKEHMYMCVNSTAAQKGLTQVVGQTDDVVKVGEAVEYKVADLFAAKDIAAGKTYNNKTISAVTFELNKRVEMPTGIVFENNTISGTFANVDLARIDIIANITYSDSTKGAVAYKFVIDAIPAEYVDGSTAALELTEEQMKQYTEKKVPVVDPPVEEKKGCFGSVTAASALISIVALAGAGLLAIGKRKED